MIKYNPHTWNLLILFKGSIIKRLMGGMIILTILTTIVCILHLEFGIVNIRLSSNLPGYMGAALGLLLVFRNNTAYDKWWEGRKILGALVNISRNIAITLTNILPSDVPEKAEMIKLVKAFPFALKEHLRSGVIMKELDMLSGNDLEYVKEVNHKPNGIANLLQAKINKLYQEGLLNDMQQYLLIGNVNELIDILGKCERIKKTPIPIAYAFLLKFFIIVYVLIIPFGLIESMGWAVILLTLSLYYIMMSIVTTAEEIEDPFGHEMNDLPVDEICQTIEKNIEEISGGTGNYISSLATTK